MGRYNIFNRVHKALRAFLYDTAMLVQQTDFAQAGEASEAQEQMGQVLNAFGQHGLYIERLVFPFVVEYNPALISTFKQQYQANTVQTQRLRGMMNAWGQAANATERKAVGELIGKEFTQFLVAQLESLAREDQQLNQVLWRFYSDAELLGIEKEIVGKLVPADLAAMSKWAIRGMNNTEIIGWMRAIERTCPSAVFSSFFNSAARELPEHRWLQIQEALAEGTSIPDAEIR